MDFSIIGDIQATLQDIIDHVNEGDITGMISILVNDDGEVQVCVSGMTTLEMLGALEIAKLHKTQAVSVDWEGDE